MPAGYSGTALIKKLGISEATRVLMVNAPGDYFDLLESDISSQLLKKKEIPDLVHLFVRSNKELETEMKKLEPVRKANPAISIWVSWYKKTAGIPTDLTEDIIRRYALGHDLVDIKVCAVSEVWSGLKLVVPRAKR
ncbi:MAG TPA: hypothetical protein VK543_00260 [Puia sp.]|nr:hypothetical protein [Puia sp.]